jgi:hypothetical protein
MKTLPQISASPEEVRQLQKWALAKESAARRAATKTKSLVPQIELDKVRADDAEQKAEARVLRHVASTLRIRSPRKRRDDAPLDEDARRLLLAKERRHADAARRAINELKAKLHV